MRKFISNLLIFVFSFFMIFSLVSCNENNISTVPSISIDVNNDEYAITGKVTSNGIAISDAIIEIRNSSYLTKSDESGTFTLKIDNVKDSINLEASKSGYLLKVIEVSKEMFVDNIANINVELLTSEITINGVVKDLQGNLLSNVNVSAKGTTVSSKTDSKGQYSIILDRLSGYELVFYKEFYEIQTIVIDNIDESKEFIKDVVLDDLKIALEGKVLNIYEGNIEGARISIVGTDYYAISDSNGNYKIDDIDLENMDFQILVSKEGYFESIYPSSDAENLELIRDYTKLPQVGETHKFDAYVTKSSDGIYFKFYVDSFTVGIGGKEEKVQVFINPGEITESNRMNGSHVAEIALCSNEDTVVVVNYINGIEEYITNFDQDEEVIYESKRLDNGKTELNLFVKYDIFRKYFGTEFAIDANSIIGLNITSWSDFLDKPAEGWYLDDMPGVDGNSWVDHNNPQDWPRLSSDGTYLYENYDNLECEMYEKYITGVVTSEGTPIENVLIELTDLGIETYTDKDGRYALTIPKEKFYLDAVEVLYSKDGYVAMSYFIDNFINNIAEKNVDLSVGNNKVSLTGYVQNIDGERLKDAKISIEDTDIFTSTDNNGYFEFVNIEVDIPYTLFVETEGYKYKEILIEELNTNVIINLLHEEIYLGTVGASGLKSYVYIYKNVVNMKYESSVDISNSEINQYLYFSDEHIYEIRFKKGWTGIYNVNNKTFETWNSKVQEPIYSTIENKYIVTQTFDLTYFADLGVDITNLKILLSENFKDYLNYKDEKVLSYNDIKTWVLLLGEEPKYEEYIPSGEFLGEIINTNTKVYYSYYENILTFTYVSLEDLSSEVSQFIVFDNDVIYEIKFNNQNWTGIYNWEKLAWEKWNAKVQNPKSSMKNGYFVYSQNIDITYFIDLGISDVLAPEIAIKLNGEFIYSETYGEIVYTDKSTWITLDLVNKLEETNTLLFGHSNIDYWDNYREDLKDVAEKYNLGSMLNIGIGGTSSSEWLSFKESLITYKADKGIFWIGTNEMPVGATAEDIISNIENTILYMKEHNSDFMVVLVLIPLSPNRLPYKDTILKLNDYIEDLAVKYDWVALADLEYEFCDDNGNPLSIWFEDGVHLTDEAYTQIFVPAIDKAFETYYSKKE